MANYCVQKTTISNHKRVLRSKQLFLLEKISDVEKISTHLVMEEIISKLKCRDIEDTLKNKTQTDAIRLMLDTLETVSESHYNIFKEILGEIGMDFIVRELEEEEANLAALDEEDVTTTESLGDEDTDESIADSMRDLTLENPNVVEGHYDICILYEDSDMEVAQKLKFFFEDLDREADNPVKIFLHDDENVVQMDSQMDKLRKIARISTLQLYIVPSLHEKVDADLQWMTDCLALKDINNGKLTVRAVLVDEKRYHGKTDPGLANMQKIKWYDNYENHFKTKMKFLIDRLKK